VTYRTGETELLCGVPKYDFNWQMTYQLEKPVLLSKGTKIQVSAWYDNSPNNAANPDPTKGCVLGRADLRGDAGWVYGFCGAGGDESGEGRSAGEGAGGGGEVNGRSEGCLER